ncbi:MAG: hypothetical protein QXP03_05015, partial [Desulfurococcaceae archaeon]
KREIGEVCCMGRRGFTTYSVCPRCGNIGYRCVEPRGGREYVYYAHYDPGSKRVRKCYVGPLYSYEHAERLLLRSNQKRLKGNVMYLQMAFVLRLE